VRSESRVVKINPVVLIFQFNLMQAVDGRTLCQLSISCTAPKMISC